VLHLLLLDIQLLLSTILFLESATLLLGSQDSSITSELVVTLLGHLGSSLLTSMQYLLIDTGCRVGSSVIHMATFLELLLLNLLELGSSHHCRVVVLVYVDHNVVIVDRGGGVWESVTESGGDSLLLQSLF
jgi:hypothetical protein